VGTNESPPTTGFFVTADSPSSPLTDRDSGTPGAGPIWTIWLVSFGIVLALSLAVLRYLSSSSSHSMTDMHASSGNENGAALIRMRSGTGLDQLLGSRLLTTWQLDSVAVALVVVVAAIYLTGVVKARRNSPDQSWPFGRTVSFMAGLLVCVLATCGSIGVYDMALFSAHMIGHLAFVMVAPALLMAGRPLELALQAATPRRRERLQRRLLGPVVAVLTAPPVALAGYASVIVGSHLTGLMDVFMRNPWAGQLEHLVYLIIGCQFFVLVLGDAPIRWQLATPARWLLLAISMAVDTFVGVIIMQASNPVAMLPVPGFAVDAKSDSVTGGAIMWFGGDGIMAAIMILLVMGWLRDPERQRQDNRGWLEQARRATFGERTGMQGLEGDLDFDNESTRLDAYNDWLAAINAEPPPKAR
jgi:cytochrome c oxidase assembly factor CtaG